MTSSDSVEGFAYCVLGSLVMVGCYLIFKKVEAGDSVFFCFCMSLGTLLVGLVVDFTLANGYYANFSFHAPPRFEASVMWGGAAWLLGTLLCPLVVRRVGVGVAVGIWDTMDLLTSWAAARFGIFGLEKEPVASPPLNYVGLVLSCMSMVAFMLVKQAVPEADAAGGVNDDASGSQMDAEVQQGHKDEVDGIDGVEFGPTNTTSTTATAASGSPDCDADVESCPTGTTSATATAASSSPGFDAEAQITPKAPMQATSKHDVARAAEPGATSPKHVSDVSLASRLCRRDAKLGGVLGAMLIGFLQGLKLDRAQYLLEQGEKGMDHSTYWADYVCPLFTGVFAAAASVLAVYLIKNGRKSYCPRSIVLPGIVAGILWGLFMLCTFQGDDKLGIVINYPLMATIMAVLTTVMAFLYGEFNTRRSCGLAVVGTLVRVIAVLLIALSSALDMEEATGF